MEVFLVKNERIRKMDVVEDYGAVGRLPKINLKETCNLGDEERIYGRFLQDKLDRLINPESFGKVLWLDWQVRDHNSNSNGQLIEVIVGGELVPLLKELIYYGRRNLEIYVSLKFQTLSGPDAIISTDTGLTKINESEQGILYQSFPCSLNRYTDSDIKVPGSRECSDILLRDNWRLTADVKLIIREDWSLQSSTNHMFLLSLKGMGEGFVKNGKLLKEYDFRIRSKDNDVIPCHKDLLSARSKVLAAMLEGDRFKEGAIKLVEMNGTSEEIGAFLAYLYSGLRRL